jgi:maltooligosyltrehalose trehalohydrolase
MNSALPDRVRNGRRLAQGAEVVAGGVHFRVWAPTHCKVELLLGDEAKSRSLNPEGDGYWSAMVDGIGAGTRYRYRLDGDSDAFPDPASRFLPEGPHGPSEVVDPRSFAWTDLAWTGLPLHGEVIYELHVGTFSPEGNWAGAIRKLGTLKELGVTVIELMPVAEFPGRFGWGYDGVAWFAPCRLYGTPDDLRGFVDQAHALGIGVILDVVYNHFGPDGNYLEKFSPHYCSERSNEWGRGINFDGAQAAAVRTLVTDNAAYWIDEFHLDGLRLDATQNLQDRSPDHIVAALTRRARAVAGGRRLLIIGENNSQDTNLLRSTEVGGYGLDALWNDDFHHSARVALTGRRQAYYGDYHGTSNEWLAAAKYGFIFQGQRSAWQKSRHGRSTRGLPPAAFIGFLENHDQVANSLWSTRVWHESSPACHRAMTALLCLGPWTPLLFQGQEWNSSAPFYYFADQKPELATLIRAGRIEFMSQFAGCAAGAGRDLLPDPASPDLFEASRLRWDERDLPAHRRALQLHRDLLALRRTDSTLSGYGRAGVSLEVAALTPTCGILRYFVDGPAAGARSEDRVLIVNLGPDLDLEGPAEPLLSPPAEPGHTAWRMLWCSEDPRYGGSGCAEPESEDRGWRLPGFAAVLLGPMVRV